MAPLLLALAGSADRLCSARVHDRFRGPARHRRAPGRDWRGRLLPIDRSRQAKLRSGQPSHGQSRHRRPARELVAGLGHRAGDRRRTDRRGRLSRRLLRQRRLGRDRPRHARSRPLEGGSRRCGPRPVRPKPANGGPAIALAFAALALFYTAMFLGSIPLPIVLTTSLGGAESDVGITMSLCAALEIVVMGALIWRPLKRGERAAIVAGFAAFIVYFVALDARAFGRRGLLGADPAGDRHRSRHLSRDQFPPLAHAASRRRRSGAVFELRPTGFRARRAQRRRPGEGVRLRLHLWRLRGSQRRWSRTGLLDAGRAGVTAGTEAWASSSNCHQAIRLWRTFIFVSASVQQSLLGNIDAYETHASRRDRLAVACEPFAARSRRLVLPLVTTQPDPPPDVAPYFVADTDLRWTGPEWSAEDIAALRQKIKYVFVIFNENRSFDHEYGTLPGVNGLYSDGKNSARARRHARISPKATSIRTPARQSPSNRSASVPNRTRRSRIRPTIPISASPPSSTCRTAFRRWTSSLKSSGANMRALAAPRARRWASSSRASSWRISTATRSRSSGATPAASPSSTTISPPKTRHRRRTRSP